MDSDSESKLISLISQLLPLRRYLPGWKSEIISLIIQIKSLVRCMDLDLQPKPESKLISLITQKISLDSDQKPDESDSDFGSLVEQTLELKPDPELISLIRQILSVVIYMNSKSKKLISLCPQVQVSFDGGSFRVDGELQLSYNLWDCLIVNWEKFWLTGGEDATHFRCRSCNGEYHQEYEKAPLEIKNPLHLKHSLELVFNWNNKTRECYCCDEDLKRVFYYCSACDCAMNIACVEKPQVLYIPPPKWHKQHQLALFPRPASLTCNICALADSSSLIYMCPPCDFVVHLKCINLPRLIRISRHHHRIYHTPSFAQGNWSCSVCHREMDNDYGGYSCIGCSYVAHSRCATQRNVWDGIDLEGVPEEIEEEEEEEVEPFVRISDGIIRHFSHDHHHLRLDENTCRDYDDNKQCQACITPTYFGNLYSCVQCEFVLHETCADHSRKIYHPIHPHHLTLAQVVDDCFDCSACVCLSTADFFYECGKEGCHFQLHVQCATISEGLVHPSHVHPLFLTSKPGERRSCRVCQSGLYHHRIETFNCIDCDGFTLCFKCATLPQKVRYKHGKHILSLSYGEETSNMTYWCEVCESKINLKEGFCMCDEYCCVTLHIKCLIGRDLYLKPYSSLSGRFSTDRCYAQQ